MKMKAIILSGALLAILLSLESSYAGNNDGAGGVNDGASTSTQQDNGPLDRCTRCELQNYAYNLVLLMTAEDLNTRDVVHMANNQFRELEAFHQGVATYTLAAGGGADLPYAVRRERFRYFHSMVEQYLLEIIENTCSGHYTFKYYYEYDPQARSITVRERVSPGPSTCLCVDYQREREVLMTTPRLPLPNPPEKKFQLTNTNGRLTMDEITAYYIIPLPLLSRFFRLWLADEQITRMYENHYQGCTNAVFGRMRRSMQKILIYGMKKSSVYSDSPRPANSDDFSFSDETALIINLQRSSAWMSGNIFFGPADRGPTNPAYARSGEELLEAFEYQSGPIVGSFHHQEMLKLFNQLLDYVRRAPVMSLFERLNSGFALFSSMVYLFYQRRATGFNPDQWERRRLLPSEVPSGTTQRSLFNFDDLDWKKYYWAIRYRRDPRSVVDYYSYRQADEEDNETREVSMLVDVKSRWRRFVTGIMTISVESQLQRMPLPWACDWAHLYSEYVTKPPVVYKPDDKCPECVTLDEFLYRKVSNNSKWNACNFKSETTVRRTKWCAAWLRIVQDVKDVNADTSSNEVSRLDQLDQRDVAIMVTWLMTLEDTDNEKRTCERLRVLPVFPFRKPSTSSLDVALCMATSFIPSLLTFSWKDCKNTMG